MDSAREAVAPEGRRYLEEAAGAPDIQVRSGAEAGTLPFDEAKIEQLDELGGIGAYGTIDPDLGNDLLDEAQETRPISLDEAVASAVANNLRVAAAELAPAINAEEAIAAEAVFDWVFFADFAWTVTDQPSPVPVVNGVPVGVGANTSQQVEYNTGLRKRVTSGGEFTVSQGQTYRDNTTPGFSQDPDPSNQATVELGFDQPLLRGFGQDVSLAEVHLSRNLTRDAQLLYEGTLIETVNETELAYWSLLLAYHELQIRQQLLGAGEGVRDQLEPRLEFDARLAEFADAVATTEQRRSQVIAARNRLRQASDRLKALIESPGLSLGGETLLLPSDSVLDQAVTINVLDALETALRQRPEIERAMIAVDSADIRVDVADDARLPRLDLQLRTVYRGLDESTGEAYEQVFDSNFVDYIVGLQFERALGNREAEAGYRARRLERLRAMAEYREAVQGVVLDVKTALRDVQTAYALIEQNRIARLAATESLRALQAREEIDGLTPTFLDLKLRRQEAVATTEFSEVGALVEYASALSRLRAAIGTTLDERGIRVVPPTGEELLGE